MQHAQSGIALSDLAAAAAPALAASLSFQRAATAPRSLEHGSSPLAIESWSAGSATLVPLMAADTQARRRTPVDARRRTSQPWANPRRRLLRARATESGRKEVAAARDARPQLKRRN
jgi:hypothetical protein